MAFPSDKGISVEFEFAAHGGKSGNQGDGFSFYLIDGTDNNTTGPGAPGGALGYACRDNVTKGVNKGYIGIGMDQFGNFSDETHAGHGGPGRCQDHVVIRGSGNECKDYCFIHGVGFAGKLGPSPGKPARVHLSVIKGRVTVAVSDGSKMHTLIDRDLPAPGKSGIVKLPAELKLGLSASTGEATNNYDIRNLAVTLPADVYTTLEAPQTVTNGTELTYTATFGNAGPNAVTDGAVCIELPQELTGVKTSVKSRSSKNAIWKPGNVKNSPVTGTVELPAGETVVLSVTGTVPEGVADGKCLTGKSTIGSKITSDPKSENNTATRETKVQYLLADLYTTLGAPQTVHDGERLVCTATFGNNGPAEVRDGAARIDLPSGLSEMKARVVASTGGGSCTSGPAVTGSVVTGALHLPRGATVVIEASGAVPERARDGMQLVSRSAIGSKATKDPVPGNNVATGCTRVRVRSADLHTTLQAQQTVVNGERLTYTATFGNKGPNAVDDGAASIELPQELTGATARVKSATGGGACVTGPQVRGSAVTGVLRLPKDATVVIEAGGTVPKTIADGVHLTGRSTIRSQKIIDPDQGNNAATCTTRVAYLPADLYRKPAAAPAVDSGAGLTCTATFGNHGPHPVNDGAACIEVPKELVGVKPKVDSTGGGGRCVSGPSVQGRKITAELDLPKGATVVISATGTVPKHIADRTRLTGTSTIRSAKIKDPNPANNTASCTTQVRALVADLWTTLDAWREQVAGSALSFTAAFGNSGPQAVDDAEVRIELSPHLTQADVHVVDASGGGAFVSGPTLNRQKHQVTGQLKLPKGGKATVRVTGTVAEKTPGGTALTCTSHVDSARTYDPAAQNNTAARTTKVLARKPITVDSKILAKEPKDGRWTYTYGIEVTYQGSLTQPAQDWVIHFRVPHGSRFLRANKPPSGLHTWNTVPEYGCSGDVAWVMSDGRSHPLPAKVRITVPVEVSHPEKNDEKYKNLPDLKADALRVERKTPRLVTA
ncbi:hypothetical protein [Streptomyces capparidis]